MLQTIANMDFRRSRYFISSYCVYMVSFFAAACSRCARGLRIVRVVSIRVVRIRVVSIRVVRIRVVSTDAQS